MRGPAGGALAGVATVTAASSEATGMLVPHRGQKYVPEPTLVPQRVQNERPATVIERSRLVTGDPHVAAQISRRGTARQLSIARMRLSGLSRTPRSVAGGPPAPPAHLAARWRPSGARLCAGRRPGAGAAPRRAPPPAPGGCAAPRGGHPLAPGGAGPRF